MHLRHNHGHNDVINILGSSHDDVQNVTAKAMYFPLIFDFLRHRLVDSSAPLHVYSLGDNIKQLNILEDYLLADFVHDYYLPQGPLYKYTRCIVTPLPQT
jgi:hypothetical protein